MSSPEAYDWQHPAHYWMVTALYGGMRASNWTERELLEAARRELTAMAEKMSCGEPIPKPILVLTKKPRPVLSREEGLKRITEIRNKFGLTRRTK